MVADDNPYAAPTTAFDIVPAAELRIVGYGMIASVGMAAGAGSFLVSMALIPSNVSSLSEHDLRLANHLGFVYPTVLALWASWVRRSLPWAIFGVISGLLIGAAYYAICRYNFLAVMVAFPCLLGGCTSVLLGTKNGSWIDGIPQRFFKGLVAGLVLGLLYAVLLNLIGAGMISSFNVSLAEYSSMIWRAGTIAMTISSGLYFVLFHWSAGLRPAVRSSNDQSGEPRVPDSRATESS